MTAVVVAVDGLEGDPDPADSFRWGVMRRLRVGQYRIMYVVEGDLITIDRVDRVITLKRTQVEGMTWPSPGSRTDNTETTTVELAD